MPSPNPRPRLFWLLATGLGSGAAPKAPGTAGSLTAVLIVAVLDYVFGFPWWGTGLLAVGAAMINVLLGSWIAKHMGSDPPAVVIDEFAGQWLALTVPFRHEFELWVLAAGFCLFRVFDISKLPGVGVAEKLPGGWGILMDDIVAGLYAGVCLLVGAWLLGAL